MEMNHCRRCGTKLRHQNDHVYTCATGHTLYANNTPTVGIFFITPRDTILLTRRAIEPMKGWLDMAGGFLDSMETYEHAAIREVEEELGLTPEKYTPLAYLCSSIGTYSFQGETLSIINTIFWSRLQIMEAVHPQDDVAEIVEVAFDVDVESLQMDEQVKTGLRRLIEKRRNNEL